MPKVHLIFVLSLIYITALIQHPQPIYFYLLPTVVGWTFFFDLLFTFIKRRAFFIPYAAIATGLIIALIVDPATPWYQIATICAIAMGTKVFLRFEGHHIFNPAAAGLFFGGIIFNLGLAWWGVSFQFANPIFLLILLLPAFISAYRLRRYASILSFLAIYTVLSFPPNSTTIFFAITMLPEPMTSPVTPLRQTLYGITVAAISLFLPPTSLPDLLTPALLLGNLLFFRYK